MNCMQVIDGCCCSCFSYSTFTPHWTESADNKLMIFLLIFSEIRLWAHCGIFDHWAYYGILENGLPLYSGRKPCCELHYCLWRVSIKPKLTFSICSVFVQRQPFRFLFCIPCRLSSQETTCMQYQNLFSAKKSKGRLLKSLHNMLSVNTLLFYVTAQ